MIETQPSLDTVVTFNELPDLLDANEAKNKHVTEEMFDMLGQLFITYHVQNIFGLTLLHNHFLLEEDEILLETDSEQKTVSQPIKIDKLATPVQGFNWKVTSNNTYVPYEFWPENEDLKIDFSSLEIQSFLEEFSRKLNELDLTHIFGMCAVNEKYFMEPGIECTEGRKNITTPLANSVDIFDKIVDATWVFKIDPIKKTIVQRWCALSCGVRGSSHAKLHKPTC